MKAIRHQIGLIDEYRTRLIADVVTGKLDVRKAAEELPELEPVEITRLTSRTATRGYLCVSTWDPEKNRRNLRIHNLTFEEGKPGVL